MSSLSSSFVFLHFYISWVSSQVVGPNSPHLEYDVRTRVPVYNTGDLQFWPSLPSADYDDTEPLDPFDRGTALFPEKPYSWSLDCESGQAMQNCNGAARPACDAYCHHQCYEYCSEPMDQETMSDCLAANDATDCSFNIDEYLYLPTKMCRTVIEFNTTQEKFQKFSGTVYIAEPDWNSVSLANFKRLKKAVLSIPMASEYNFTYTDSEDEISLGKIRLPKDVGNLFNLADGFNVSTCKLDLLKLPFTVASLQNHDVFRADFGAMYYKHSGGVGEAPYTYENDVTRLLHARSLQLLGGLPKQLLVWWSGLQPDLYSSKEVSPDVSLLDGQYTEDAILKVMYQYPPARFFRAGGFHTATMDAIDQLFVMRAAALLVFFISCL